jgi:hypothetical protein
MKTKTRSNAMILVGCAMTLVQPPAHAAGRIAFQLVNEVSLSGMGGIPYCVDLDQDGRVDILWLQSPGCFHSKVFDKGPYQGRHSEAERAHFCLTATDANAKIRWQIGQPWRQARPFVSHGAELVLDTGDIDGDGVVEVVCIRGGEFLILDAETGRIEDASPTAADNISIIRLGHTGPRPTDWTILAKNSGDAYPPYEYGNPTHFYDNRLKRRKSTSYLGAGHAPQAIDVDGDGLDEFLIGLNLVDHNLSTVWTFEPVAKDDWNAAEMHVDDAAVGEQHVAVAASDMAYLLDKETGKLIWKHQGVHPQHCQIGAFDPQHAGDEIFIHNKRADLQLYTRAGAELWRITPPTNFPLGQAAPCQRQKFHVFDPTILLKGRGQAGTDLLIFTDAGWPYVIDGAGRRCLDFDYTTNMLQDWGEVPGRPDDYGYGFYARVADFDGDGQPEVLISDRRFRWLYEIVSR